MDTLSSARTLNVVDEGMLVLRRKALQRKVALGLPPPSSSQALSLFHHPSSRLMDCGKTTSSLLKLLGALALHIDASTGLTDKQAKRFGEELKELVEEAQTALPASMHAALLTLAAQFSSSVPLPLSRCANALSTLTIALSDLATTPFALSTDQLVTRHRALEVLPAEVVFLIVDAIGEGEPLHSRLRQRTAKRLTEVSRRLNRTARPALFAEAHLDGALEQLSQVAEQIADGRRPSGSVLHLSARFPLEDLQIRGESSTTWPGLDLANLIVDGDGLKSLSLELYTNGASWDYEEEKLTEVLGVEAWTFQSVFVKPSMECLWLPLMGDRLGEDLLHLVRSPPPKLRELRLGHTHHPFNLSAEAGMWDRSLFSGRDQTSSPIAFHTLALPWYAFSTTSFLSMMALFEKPPSVPPLPHPLQHFEGILHFPPTISADEVSSELTSICAAFPSIRRLTLRIFFLSNNEDVQAAFSRTLVRRLRKCRQLEHLEIGGVGLSRKLPFHLSRLSLRTLVFLPCDDNTLTPADVFDATDEILSMGTLEEVVLCLPMLAPHAVADQGYTTSDLADFLESAKTAKPPVKASVQYRSTENAWVRQRHGFR